MGTRVRVVTSLSEVSCNLTLSFLDVSQAGSLLIQRSDDIRLYASKVHSLCFKGAECLISCNIFPLVQHYHIYVDRLLFFSRCFLLSLTKAP